MSCVVVPMGSVIAVVAITVYSSGSQHCQSILSVDDVGNNAVQTIFIVCVKVPQGCQKTV